MLQACSSEEVPVPEIGPAEMAGDDTSALADAPGNVQQLSTLRVALSLQPAQRDPALFETTEAFQFGFMLYDGLVWVDHQLMPQPMLAKSWEHDDSLLEWTFHLRRDVSFHHGTAFTAADVVYTLERLIAPEVGSQLRSVLSFVASVEAVDDYTVRIHCQTPNVDLPLLLGAAPARILAHDYDARLISSAPSGTGPFQMHEFVPGQRISFVRNEDYWDSEQLYLAEVHHFYLASLDEQVAALVAGDVDLIADIGSQHIEALEDNPEIEILEEVSGAYQTIVMQATEPPFNDTRVRQALKHCVDREAMRQLVLQGRGALGNDQPVAPMSPFWAELPVGSQDINQARQLLADAGHPDGLQLDLITSASRPGMVELANAYQEMAALAGITINVITVPTDIYWSDYGGRVPFHIGNWNFRPSIDETFMLAYHSISPGNESRWSSPKLDEWIDAARAEPDPDERKSFYRQAQQLIMQEGAVIVPYYRPILTAIRKSVQGFAPHPAGWLDLRGVQNFVAEQGSRLN